MFLLKLVSKYGIQKNFEGKSFQNLKKREIDTIKIKKCHKKQNEKLFQLFLDWCPFSNE